MRSLGRKFKRSKFGRAVAQAAMVRYHAETLPQLSRESSRNYRRTHRPTYQPIELSFGERLLQRAGL